VDFGGIGALNGLPGATGGAADGVATLTGNCWGYGFKIGATYQATDTLRFGAGFTSADNLKINGNVGYSGVPAALTSAFGNGAASTTLNLPATASGGFTWDITHEVSVQGEVAWTGWSTFKTLDIKFASGTPDEIDQENWKSTMFYSVGSVWKVNPSWALKAGLGYDQTPVPDSYRTPRIPDSSRTWISLGAGWNATKALTVDVGLTRVVCKPVVLELQSGTTPASPNYYKGNLTGTYDVGATVVAASVRYQF
jgi:long-chain fatty acid transport protein